MDINKSLQQLGLNQKEAQIYLSLLQLGNASVLSIAKQSSIKRPTVYEILESLKNQGLVFENLIGKKKFWQAQAPDKLEEMMQNKLERIKNILPELKTIYNLPQTKPKVLHYEGFEGIKNAYGSLISDFEKGENYYIISSSKDWFSIDEEYFLKFVEKRNKSGVVSRMLCPKTKENQIYSKFAQTKFLPKDINFSTNMVVYQNKIIYSSIEEKFALVVESRSLANQQKQMFELLWKLIK